MLLVIGDVHEETVVDLSGPPSPGEVGAAHIVRRRGGSAANIAAFASILGCPTRLAGQVGEDHSGAFVLKDLVSCGVDVRVRRKGRTAVAVILHAGDTTTRLVDRADATQCTSLGKSVLDGVRLVHVPASSLSREPLATAVERLLGEAMERAIPITIDAAGIETIAEFGARELRTLVDHVRPYAFFCNRSESERLGLHGRAPITGASWTVVTAGERPALLVASNGHARVYPVPPVDAIIDRDGAGDGFVTGFLLAHLAGQTPGNAVRAGHIVAARVIRQRGLDLARAHRVASAEPVPASRPS